MFFFCVSGLVSGSVSLSRVVIFARCRLSARGRGVGGMFGFFPTHIDVMRTQETDRDRRADTTSQTEHYR